jgi:hypothetical protein
MTVIRTILGANFTNKKLAYNGGDPLLTGGSVALFDFANVLSNSGQPTSVISPPKNLAPSGVIMTSASGVGFVYSGGGAQISSSGGSAALYGGVQPIDLSNYLGNEILATVWLKAPAAQTRASCQIFRYGEAALGGSSGRVTGKNQISFETGSDPRSLRAYVAGKGDPALSNSYGFPVCQLANDTVTQAAIHIQPNAVTGITTISIYNQGVYISDFTVPYVAFAALTAPQASFGNDPGSDRTGPSQLVLYRASVENISLSGRDVPYVVARDYALNNGRFS